MTAQPQLDLASLFDEDEVYVDFDFSSDFTEEELLSQRGVLNYSKSAKALGIDKTKLLNHLRLEQKMKSAKNQNANVFEKYGLKRIKGSQWQVQMSKFKKFLPQLRRDFPSLSAQALPKNIDREGFFALKGSYRAKDILACNFLPFSDKDLMKFLKTVEPSKEIGVWWEGSELIIDFEKFIVLVYSLNKRISLERAREIVYGGNPTE